MLAVRRAWARLRLAASRAAADFLSHPGRGRWP